MKKQIPWTPDELRTLHHCVASGMSVKETHRVLGRRTPEAVQRKAGEQDLHFTSRHFVGHRKQEPVVAELNVVESRNTTTLTAFVFGDPPPGRSALDQRRQ